MKKTKDMISDDGRNDTVAELYALRAGLSVISQIADDIRDCEDEIEDVRERIKPIQNEIENNTGKIAKFREKIETNSERISYILSNSTQMVDNRVTQGLPYSLDPLKVIIFGACLIPILIFVCVVKPPVEVKIIMFSIDSMFIVIPAIFYIKHAVKRKKYRDKVYDELDSEIAEKEDQIEETKENIAAIEEENNKLYEERKEIKENIEKDVAVIEGKIEANTRQAQLCRKALETQYGRLLNTADWHNIDLCIFYLQTGRADTIKECLLLADRQRQNDEIVGTLEAASDRICSEIRGGFAAIGSTMVTCINALSTQIESVNSTMLAQQHDTIRALGAIENSNQALLSSAQINNALQAKANETSEELLRDYRYIQEQSGFTVY